ncbi:hypothetical protein ACJIZ3_014294 [Penstemon smallii]|uniref:Uncharacterized protein n=1 Tax=Penstemon smallii TaxID=265156 RepID=A0ABD3RQS5_9LAMI
MSASSCMELYIEGAPLPLKTINRSLSGQHYIMKIRKRKSYMGDSMHHQYVVLNMLLYKAIDNVGFNTAITDATLSVSRELFPPRYQHNLSWLEAQHKGTPKCCYFGC